MNNTATIEAINNFTTGILEKRSKNDFQEMHLDDLTVDEGMKIDGVPLDEASVKVILSSLQLKPGFLDFKKTLSEQDWTLISRKLKEAKGDTIFYGNVVKTGMDEDDYTITDLTPQNVNKKLTDDLTRTDHIITKITEALGDSDRDYDPHNLGFSNRNNMFSFDLTDKNSEFNPFGDESWKTGTSFGFNPMSFTSNPFLERLVCSNGMSVRERGSLKTHIRHASFNNEKIAKTILNAINQPADIGSIVGPRIDVLSNVNLSVKELFFWRNYLNNMDEGAYTDLVEKFLPTQPLYKSYSLDVDETPDQWKRTADAGINAYNFLNLLTWMASHLDQTKMDSGDAADLKIMAGEFMFRKEFDLHNMAEKVAVEYPIAPEML